MCEHIRASVSVPFMYGDVFLVVRSVDSVVYKLFAVSPGYKIVAVLYGGGGGDDVFLEVERSTFILTRTPAHIMMEMNDKIQQVPHFDFFFSPLLPMVMGP